jgi:glycosyltransferase involved in cell wall biosynthesis
VDNLIAIPDIDEQAFQEAERRLLTNVDQIFTTHQNISSRLKKEHENVNFLPNVVDFEHFNNPHDWIKPDALRIIEKPVIGFHGALSNFKVDFDLLLELCSKNPHWHFFIIGDEREKQSNDQFSKIVALNNVTAPGFVDYEELPEYIACFDVAIMPFLLNDYTSGMFPMKYFEYVAARRRIVSTNLDFLASVEHEVAIAKTADEFATCIEKALHEDPISNSHARKLVGQNTWDDRLDTMLDKLELGK